MASLRNNLSVLNKILRVDNISIQEPLVGDAEKAEIHIELSQLYSSTNQLELAYVELDQASAIPVVQSDKQKVIQILNMKMDIERRRQRLNRAEQLQRQIEKLERG
ncbi:hypothetical protein E3P99_00530 [Wallemia hederae]|uniref:Uncharacterized protein n=1 Tax=Wallemia hederae TaxID=1540922 RepID=A0A4T0FVI6_9BASI|nr:hypothetical protein E3P99_00530 [Wallemia hederae]